MTEEGTITPEIRIQALEEALATETERVQKLFAAYEGQEKKIDWVKFSILLLN